MTVLIENVIGLIQKVKEPPNTLSDAEYVLDQLNKMGYHGPLHVDKALCTDHVASVIPIPRPVTPSFAPLGT